MCYLGNDWSWAVVFWYAQGGLTIVIAGLALYIAYQQWRTNARKSKLDLFDRRFRVFLEVRKVLSSVLPEATAKTEDFLKFRTGVAESYFLFRPEIEKYLDDIYLHGIALATADYLYRLPKEERSADHDHKKIVEDKNSNLKWLMEQLPAAKEKFKKYLDMSKL